MKKIIILVCLLPLFVHAQINAESMRDEKNEDGFSGLIDWQFDSINGNFEKDGISLNGKLFHQKNDYDENRTKEAKHFVLAAFSYQKADIAGNVITNSKFHHVRYTRMFSDFWGLEVLQQEEFNQFKFWDKRSLYGASTRFNIFREKNYSLYYGAGYIREFLWYQEGTRKIENLFANYINFKFDSTDQKIKYRSTLYYQPVMDDIGDYKISFSNQCEFVINKWISYVLNLDLRYEHNPPEGVQTTDSVVLNKFRVRF